ncbi:MAG: radical SAM protein [Candidatus Stahlbacteria bacterium]|nr:radical SAM protein [Candidatus Stahlbacteria bacterium]
MRYFGNVIRPPSEAESYILQVTFGCSHNKCTFCPTYLDKSFRIRPVNEIMEDIETAHNHISQTRRIFLADGNALVLSNQKLMPILDALNSAFPELQRIGIYANTSDILRKTDQELKELRAKKLSIIYIGLESGSNKVLKRVNKGVTAEETINAVGKAQNAGFKVSVIGILGLGGADLLEEHAVATGRAISAMSPLYFSLLTLMIVPGTALHTQWTEGKFILPNPLDMLQEMRVVIENIKVSSGCIFRTNHASNYLPLAGRLPNDKERLLITIDHALAKGEPSLRPEFLRGL